MSFANINIGTYPSDGTGDPLRVAFNKINQNFAAIESGQIALTVNAPVKSVAGRTGNVVLTANDIAGAVSTGYVNQLINAANLAAQSYTTSAVDAAINHLVDSAPLTLDTLKEIASALGNDANMSTTLTNMINGALNGLSAANTRIDGQNASITSLTAGAASQQSLLTTLTANAASQQSSIVSLQSDVAAIDSQITTLSASVIAANATVATFSTDIAALQTNAASQQTFITTLTANASAQADSLATLNTSIATLTANAASQQTLISTLNSNAASQQTIIADLYANAAVQAGNISAVNTSLTNINTQVNALNANAVAQQASITTLTANAGAQSDSLAALIANTVSQQTSIISLANGATATNAAIVTANTAIKDYVDTVTTAWTANAANQQTAITTLTANAASQQSSIVSLQTLTTAHSSNIATINANVTAANTHIAQIDATIGSINSAVADIYSTIDYGPLNVDGNVSANFVTINAQGGIVFPDGTVQTTATDLYNVFGNIRLSGDGITTTANGDAGIFINANGNGEIHLTDNTGINNPNPGYWLHVGNTTDNNTGTIAIDYGNGVASPGDKSGSAVLAWDWWDNNGNGSNNDGTAHANFGIFKGGMYSYPWFTISGNAPANSLSIDSTGTLVTDSAKIKYLKSRNAIRLFELETSAPTTTKPVDVATSASWMNTANCTQNFTLNIRGNATATFNSISSVGEQYSIQYIVTNGSTGFYLTGIQIDGVAVTPKWAPSAPTVGTANGMDTYWVYIFKTGNGQYIVQATYQKYV